MDPRYQAFVAVLFYLALSTTNAQAPPTCNTAALDECVNRYNSVSILFQNFTTDNSTIEQNCKAYNDAVFCVSNTTQCNDTERSVIIKWIGARQAQRLICAEGKSDYLKYQRCLGNGTFSTLMRTNCSVVTNYMQPLQNSLTADPTCKQYTEALDCYQWAAETACGKETGDYMRKHAAIYLDPQVKNIAPTCTGRCNSVALDACLKDFKPYGDRFLAASLNSTDLVDACRLHPLAAQCIKDRTTCTDEDTLTQIRWGGNKALAEYTCGEGRNVYLRNRECLSNSTYIQSRDRCSQTSTTCQAVVNQVICMNNVTDINCGKEAAGFMSTIAPRFLAPTIRAISPGCSLPGLPSIPGLGSNAVSLLATTLTLITSLLIAALL